MFSSFRVRLTVWYTAMLGLILAVFSIGVYLLVADRLYEQTDSGLRALLDVAASSLRHEIEEHKGPGEGERLFASVLGPMHQASFPRLSISVFCGDRLMASQTGASGPVTRPAGVTILPQPHFMTEGVRRLGLVRIHIDELQADYDFVVAEPLDRTRAELVGFARIIGISVPFALALAAGLGYLLARKSLAPVVAMSSEVDRLTARSLDERLTVVNPNDELGRLASTFNRLLGRLNESFEQQRRFMADASHELRTPICVALTTSDVTLAGTDKPTAEYKEALSLIGAQMRRLSRVVNSMFTLARADSGAFVVHRRSFYLNDILEEALKAAQQLARPKAIRITADPWPEAPFTGDEDLIRQLLLILLDNAVKYTPDSGSVHMRLDPGYTVTVSDTGIGIPDDSRDHIFDRFYRVDKSRSRNNANQSGGAGLGLSIARWIVELHHGKLELVSSFPDRGSTFAATLPQ